MDYETNLSVNLTTSQNMGELDYDVWSIKGNKIEWNGDKREQDIEEKLKKLIKNVFGDIKVEGSIKWQGEDNEDFGTILVKDNFVETQFQK